MLPQKIQGPRLGKNAFSEISAWKNWIKSKSARSIALKFGRFKKIVCSIWGMGGGDCPPLAAALLFEIKCYVLLVKNPPNPNA